jgi:type I restriction enzyme, S subunit
VSKSPKSVMPDENEDEAGDWDLPDSWCWVKFDDVATVDSNLVDPAAYPSFPHIAPNHIESGSGRLLPYKTVSADGVTSSKHLFRSGHILYSKIRPYLAKVVLVDFEGLCSADMYPISTKIEYGYLHRWLVSPMFTGLVSQNQERTILPKINQEALSRLAVPLAPIPEQRRIVAKLDALQSCTRIAREALDAVAPLLKSFRQSVLQASVTGALTEEWRSKQRKLPEWESILISDAGKIQLGRQRSPKYHSGDNMRPYLRVQNVFEDRLDLSDVMTMEFSADDFERYRLVSGDILLNEGQSPELLGRPAMYRGELEGACFTNTLIRFQAFPNVMSEYALLVFRHYMRSGKFRQEGTITTNIAHLGAGRFSSLDFPLPPLAEQTEIVRRVRHLFAMADAMEAEFAAAQRSVDLLDQSLLATAFRGELVPQDPSDEPASVLLERIRGARAALPKAKSKRGRNASSDFDASVLMAAEPAAPKKRGRPPKR